MFLGISTLNLDAKGRLAVPAKYREELARCCGSRVVVTLNPLYPCLFMYPENEWGPVLQQLLDLPFTEPKSQAMKHLVLGHACELEPDGQGRILLPTELREFAALDKRVSLVGQGNKFEIWDAGNWAGNRERCLKEVASPEGGLSEKLAGITL